MIIYKELHLKDFEFWSGATYTRDALTDEDIDVLNDVINDLFGDGLDETALNDLFWFEQDTLADWLGYASWEDMMEEREAEERAERRNLYEN